MVHRDAGFRPAGLPPMRSATVCAGRFPLPDAHLHRAGAGCGGARARPVGGTPRTHGGRAGDDRITRMTTTAMTAVGARAGFDLDRVAFWLLLAFVASLQLSIAAAGVLLTAALLAWAALLLRDRVVPSAPGFMVPLAAYAGATLVSAVFSLDPWASFVDSKQLVLLLIVPMVYHVARGRQASMVIDTILAVGAASAAYGIIQYGLLQYDSLRLRPDGALTHYMTYSGTLMLVLCAAVARLVFGSRDRVWPALVMPALVVALAVSLGRNAWVGACAAVGLLLAMRDFRLVALLPAAIAL